MKTFFSILAVLIIGMAVWKLWEYYERVGGPETGGSGQTTAPAAVPLPSLPPKLEQELADARKRGAVALKAWLDRHRPHVKDPRLAAIELDYVVMVSATDPVQAKKLFQEIKQRTPPDSPVYPRLKDLEKTYD
jgi:hypothetical protein